MSKGTCIQSGASSCDWYHGTWKYLRLLDLVSTPSWHAPFIRRSIAEVGAGRGDLRVLISGCADYAMYALVHSQLADSAEVTAIDLCPTPLVSTAEYAEHIEAAAPELLVGDAIDHLRPGFYDIIVSDSFLPRFSTDELRKLLAAWRMSLSPEGIAPTTVRLPRTKRDPRSEQTGRLDRWIQTANDARPWWSDLSDLPFEELIRRISVFVENQERNTALSLSRLHTLFVEAGFQPTITTRSHRGRDFALVEACKVMAQVRWTGPMAIRRGGVVGGGICRGRPGRRVVVVGGG